MNELVSLITSQPWFRLACRIYLALVLLAIAVRSVLAAAGVQPYTTKTLVMNAIVTATASAGVVMSIRRRRATR